MDWAADSWWQAVFFEGHGTLAQVWGPVVAPLVAIVSFVCSVGNVPLAAVLWNGGISFGGALAFIFADLIVLPILDIYRRYYGRRMAGFLLATFYATMAAAGLIVDLLFQGAGLAPTSRSSLSRRVGRALLPPRRRRDDAAPDEPADGRAATPPGVARRPAS
jgi:uncharacterized membrane protein YraQ (UPF0718 family)